MKQKASGQRIVDVRVSGAGWPMQNEQAEALVREVLRGAEQKLGPLREGVLEVWFADDEDLRALNQRFRDKDAPTNILSFAAPQGPGQQFGQLALAAGICTTEAGRRGLALLDHVRHLVLHGMLHVQGYDHESDEDAAKMEKLEWAVMKTLHLHDPYVVPKERHDP